MKKTIIAVLAALVVFTTGSCVSSTMVRFRSDIENVDVYVDGEKEGQTGSRIRMSNAVWEETDVVFRKAGYKDEFVDMRKEPKMINIVFGVLLWWPSFLYCYGPSPIQPVVTMTPR